MLATTMPRARQAARSTLSVPVRQLGQFGRAQRHLVGDGDRGALQAFHHLFRRGGRVIPPVVREAGTADGGEQAVAVEKDESVHGGSRVKETPL
jgi:hypothetical protein